MTQIRVEKGDACLMIAGEQDVVTEAAGKYLTDGYSVTQVVRPSLWCWHCHGSGRSEIGLCKCVEEQLLGIPAEVELDTLSDRVKISNLLDKEIP